MKRKDNEIRESLLESAAFVVGNEGYNKATTLRIAKLARVNEAYIYRYFESKEDLIRCRFNDSDRRLAAALEDFLPLLESQSIPWEDRCRAFFKRAWEKMTDTDYRVKFCVRYYYSEQFRLYAREEHVRCYAAVADGLRRYFAAGVPLDPLLIFAFESTIGLAFRVACGETEGTEENVERQFMLIYKALSPCFRTDLATDIQP